MRSTTTIFILATCVVFTFPVHAAEVKDKLEKASIIATGTVKVRMEEPVLIDQASPQVKEWGPYRMPKVFRLPGGELGLTFAVGLDLLQAQGKSSPLFVSSDGGKSWRRSTFPHPRMNGMNPLIVPIGDGEYYCLPAGNGLPADVAQMPKPLYERGGGYGTAFRLYRLEDCPAAVQRWFQEQKAVRWSPKTGVWREEALDWDRLNQVVYCYLEPGDKWWTQKVYMEVPPVVDGKELLFADYWTLYSVDGKAPGNWQCSLMASGDNGRTWRRRSVMIDGEAYGDVGEPTLVRNTAGELVSIIRRDPMPKLPTLIIYSRDHGRTWTRPKEMFDRGAFPQLLLLQNGVMVHSFGRPGVWLSFSLDGGHAWTQPQAVIAGDPANNTRHSCGYTSLLAVGRDSFLIAYSEFERPNPQGLPAKAILIRKIAVRPAKETKID